MTELIDQLLQLTALGIYVMPVWGLRPDGGCQCSTNCGEGNRGKHPMAGLRWQDKASTDPRRLENWVVSFPDANWGVLTGVRSGVFVIDIDPKNGGPETWAKFTTGKELPETLEVRTGSGGTHYYFRMPSVDPVETSLGFVKGVDVKGDTSMVVIPPSLHHSGQRYEWVRPPGQVAIADAPPWLLEAVRTRQKKARADLPKLGGVAKLGERDDALFHNAVGMLRQGLAPDAVVNALWAWVETGGVEQTPQDPITRPYVEGKVDAALRYAQKNRADVPREYRSTMNDAGNAARLVGPAEGQFLHATGVGWLTWDGTRWAPDQDQKVVLTWSRETLEGVLRDELLNAKPEVAKNVATWLQQSLNHGRLISGLAMLAALPGVRTAADGLDSDPWSVSFRNGTLNVRTGELRPHAPEDRITKMVDCDYDPAAECPTWMETLGYAFPDDPEMQAFMQRAMGYSITGSQDEQCLFVCWGPTGYNGKSTLLNSFQRILGMDYAGDLMARALTDDRMSAQAMSRLAALRGARYVVIGEASDAGALNEEFVKAATGNDPITARFLYQNAFSYTPEFKLWLAVNDYPVVRSGDDPMWRRIRLIPFQHIIPPDRRRPPSAVWGDLWAQRAGILAWAVRGARDWLDGGMQVPERVIAATQEYRTDMDIISSFLAEETEEGEGYQVTTRELYQQYQRWCKASGIRWIMSHKRFSQRLMRTHTVTPGHARSAVVHGLRVASITFGTGDGE